MSDSVSYRERMWPTPWMFVLFGLLLPAVMLLFLPIDARIGFVLAPLVYLIVVGVISFSAPVLTVADGRFHAGSAVIDCTQLGEIRTLGRDELTLRLGIRADARAFLMIRGWIHTAIEVENIDPDDPAPYWIVTTRHPRQLAEAIEAAKRQRAQV